MLKSSQKLVQPTPAAVRICWPQAPDLEGSRGCYYFTEHGISCNIVVVVN